MALKIDMSLKNLNIAGLSNYENEFGTKKEEGVGLTTEEITNNELLPYKLQKAILLEENAYADVIEHDGKFIFTKGDLLFTLSKASYSGCKLEFYTNYENGTCFIKYSISDTETITKSVDANLKVTLISDKNGYFYIPENVSVSRNTANIATNTANIATNTANIATNTENIATNTANIATNTADIATKTNILFNGAFKSNVVMAAGSVTVAHNTQQTITLTSGYEWFLTCSPQAVDLVWELPAIGATKQSSNTFLVRNDNATNSPYDQAVSLVVYYIAIGYKL